jgi:hypothetical protein
MFCFTDVLAADLYHWYSCLQQVSDECRELFLWSYRIRSNLADYCSAGTDRILDLLRTSKERTVIISAIVAALLVLLLLLGGYMTAKIQALIDQMDATGKVLEAAFVAINTYTSDGATPAEVAALTASASAMKAKADAVAAALPPVQPS